MVKESIDQRKYKLTEDNALKNLRTSKNFLNEILKDSLISLMIYCQHLTNQPEYMLPLKRIHFDRLIG